MKKSSKLTFLIFILLIFSQCGSVRQVTIDNHTFYNNNRATKNIEKFDIYLHEGKRTFRFDPDSFNSDTLKGVAYEVPATTVNPHPGTRKELKSSKQNVHIYLSKELDTLQVDKTETTVSKKVAIDRNSVDRVDAFARNEKQLFAGIALFLGVIILSVLAVIAIIFATVKASTESTKASGEASGNSSDGSNSNSNSDSGGSGDSGGSNSGCYIATMAYGSYDAPNVLVLRKFRDQFLSKHKWGRSFISWYYQKSPEFVERHKSKPILVTCIRKLLNVFVWMIKPFFGN